MHVGLSVCVKWEDFVCEHTSLFESFSGQVYAMWPVSVSVWSLCLCEPVPPSFPTVLIVPSTDGSIGNSTSNFLACGAQCLLQAHPTGPGVQPSSAKGEAADRACAWAPASQAVHTAQDECDRIHVTLSRGPQEGSVQGLIIALCPNQPSPVTQILC